MDKEKVALSRLRRLGFPGPYEAWLCVEHGQCPRGVDYVEAFDALMDYLEALAEKGESPVGEWEKRYAEQRRAEEKTVAAL